MEYWNVDNKTSIIQPLLQHFSTPILQNESQLEATRIGLLHMVYRSVNKLACIFEMIVWRIGGQSRIFEGFADGEMVETLIVIVADTHYFVDGVIKKAPDSRASDAVGFCF